MEFGSDELIESINDSLRELSRRIDGEYPKPGCFISSLEILRGIGHPASNKVGFPNTAPETLEALIRLLEGDGIRGQQQMTPINLKLAASLMTSWHDNNLAAKARKERGTLSGTELDAWQANSNHAGSACR